jgi:hypothetical protein
MVNPSPAFFMAGCAKPFGLNGAPAEGAPSQIMVALDSAGDRDRELASCMANKQSVANV